MIHVITPCSRPENLRVVYESIPIPCRWTIVLDSTVVKHPEVDGFRSFLDVIGTTTHIFSRPMVVAKEGRHTGMWGNCSRNQALDELWADDNDWIYFLDDDNLIHPDWYWGVLHYLDTDAVMLGWGQLNRNGSLRLPPPHKIRLNRIDTASYMVRWRALKDIRFQTELRDADGRLAIEVDSRYGHLTIDRPLCWYNALR